MPAETLYPHVDGSGRGMDDGDCIHCGVSGSLEGAECPVRMRKLIRRMERWQPYDEHGQPVTQAAYNALVSRLATEGERMETIARLTRERDEANSSANDWYDAALLAQARAEKAERERDDLRVDAEVLSDRFAEVRALADTEDLRRILDEFGEHEPDSWEEFQRVDGDGILTVAVEPGSAVPAGAIVTKREKPHPCGGTLDCAAPARLWAEFGMRQGRDYTRRLVSSRNF